MWSCSKAAHNNTFTQEIALGLQRCKDNRMLWMLSFPFSSKLLTLMFVYRRVNRHQLQSLKWLHMSLHKTEAKRTESTNEFPLYLSPPNVKLRMNQTGFFNFSPGITIINASLNNYIPASYLQVTCTDVIIWDLEVVTLRFIFSSTVDFLSPHILTHIHSFLPVVSKQSFIVLNGKTYPVRQENKKSSTTNF